MIYEIINPSDAYTMKADSFDVAAVAVALLGEGHYGAKNVENDDERTPVLFGWDAFFEARGIVLDTFAKKRSTELADCLESVMIGSPDDRAELDTILAALPDDTAREKFLANRHDRRRSSMNDIGSHAQRLAKRFRELVLVLP